MQHQPNRFFVLVKTDKETTNSVFYFLREIKKSVFVEPTADILEKYIVNEKEIFIVKPLVSEAPTQNVNNVETTTIEKMLVDIFSDDIVFSAQQGAEMQTIFKNAFDKYTINQSNMLRYADRRRKKERRIKPFCENNFKLKGSAYRSFNKSLKSIFELRIFIYSSLIKAKISMS